MYLFRISYKLQCFHTLDITEMDDIDMMPPLTDEELGMIDDPAMPPPPPPKMVAPMKITGGDVNTMKAIAKCMQMKAAANANKKKVAD